MKVLLAVDHSDASTYAAQEVAIRPWPIGTTVRVLSVTEPQRPPSAPPISGGDRVFLNLLEADRQSAQAASELTARVCDALEREGVGAEGKVRGGSPASEILEEAATWSADLIVLGTRDPSKIERLFLGSVAQSVVSQAPCSVEIARRKRAKTSAP
jgi:nucleotide-binding universal stress UspA family protein